MVGAVLGGAVLGGAVLGGAVLGGAVLGGAVLGGAVLGGAVLGGAVLGGKVGPKLHRVVLQQSVIQDVRLPSWVELYWLHKVSPAQKLSVKQNLTVLGSFSLSTAWIVTQMKPGRQVSKTWLVQSPEQVKHSRMGGDPVGSVEINRIDIIIQSYSHDRATVAFIFLQFVCKTIQGPASLY